MRSLLLGAVIAAVSLGAANAQAAKSVAVAAKDAAAHATRTEPATRKVFVCDNEDLTRRSFARAYGAVEFVTAEEAVKSDAAWSGAKCMRSSEHMRLKRLKLASR
ncbi:hypothetical protein [Phenylobacterium ferrooxidans]|uniref:Uncharacterized protein n=1 Tax=Phenylobacterium ferrooxidans TaxID=2982689 RepID=A0ABW6CLZ8_9CAUL